MAFGIPNIERIVSNFLEGGTGITAIRSVEWAKSYLWAIDFVAGSSNAIGPSCAPPAPFDALFPASDVTLNIGTIVSDEREFGQTSISFPKRSSQFTMTVTFFDDQKLTLHKWFKDWINIDILNNGDFISGLNDSHAPVVPTFDKRNRVFPSREVRLVMLDAYRKEVTNYHLRIYPTGAINWVGSQGSQATQYTVSFNIVEDLGKKNTAKKAGGLFGFTFDDVKQLLGRFI